jgi:RNA-binding protein YlmH
MSSIHSRLTKEETFYIKRIEGLYHKAVKIQRAVFTPFVSPQILAYFTSFEKLNELDIKIFRINPFAEQVIMAFVPKGMSVTDDDYPVSVLEVVITSSEKITHRDVLGSLMGLGIKRELVGDIFLDETGIFIVATGQMVPFLKDNLLMIGKHHIRLEEASINRVKSIEPKGEDRMIAAASKRLDLLISKVFNLSRSKSQLLFGQGKVKCNHLVLSHYKREMVEGDLLSVRGSGRFRLLEELGTTRKGNIQLRVRVFK